MIYNLLNHHHVINMTISLSEYPPDQIDHNINKKTAENINNLFYNITLSHTLININAIDL